ncbi:glycosyltransferase family 2 protein [Candidatus Nanosynbacter sp. TM7-074]|uniref:Glycosyltransferase family 2 protein n=1 Tax=Candidatus Nanosynbacter sp. TM7-074 TaxID=3158573 RepID=A0AB39J420_9BACT
MDIEIPLGKRTKKYRFFEILPGLLSYGAIILLIILSIVNPVLASIYLLTIILVAFVKTIAISYRVVSGHRNMERASRVDWSRRLMDLESPKESYSRLRDIPSGALLYKQHLENLRFMSAAEEGHFPKPGNIYNALIMPAYNESIEVIEPALKSVLETTYDKTRLIVVFAYEERGGAEIDKTAHILKEKYGKNFHSFHIVKHPKDLPNEVVGKGGNITYAGKWLQQYLQHEGIAFSDVIVTTMDCDNKPHKHYFDYLTYEYITHEDRKHLSFQPICLFTNNIWDVPAPMRVVATGNSFWNIISSMRPYSLRNFASHAQPMSALVEMNFWSTRTIVEDGHQYWRSYFYFNGNYEVVPMFVPIYQDAVLSNGYVKTLRAQFIQLRRWSYGASDVAYVGNNVFNKDRKVRFLPSLARFIRLLDGHVTQACIALIVAFGGWAPLVLNGEAARSVAAHQLPDTVSLIQQVAMVGILVLIFVSFKLLPPRPERYKKRRNILMVMQWALMPVIAIVYSSMASYNAQTHLLLGKYLDKFDVTEKTTVEMNDQGRSRGNKKRGDRVSSAD